jgi:Predicted membrane protein (DUF2231)
VDSVLGVPAHPLIVHVPVVFIPLTLVVAVAAVAWPRGRRPLSLAALGCALVGALGAQLATMSGEGLEEQVRATSLVHQHADLGEATRTLSFVMVVAAAAYCARVWVDVLPPPIGRRLEGLLAPRAVGTGLAVALLLTAVLTTTWAVRAGHKGAEAAWGSQAGPAGTARAAAPAEGSRITTLSPPSGASSSDTVPSSASTRLFTIARPSPDPA